MKCVFKILAVFIIFHLYAQAEENSGPEPVVSLVKENEDIPPVVINSTREFRERLLSDPYRPAFHFAFPEDVGVPGDPNGAFYKDGLYHLMFLYDKSGEGFNYQLGSYERSFAWGHVSSPDLLHWRYHPDALVPSGGDYGAFSGGAFVDDDGTAVLSYWMLWGAQGIGLATSKDYNVWKRFPGNPVIKSTEFGVTEMKDASGKDIYVGSSDPSNIWKKDGKYYMLTGSLMVLEKLGRKEDSPADEQGDRLYLFESDDLKSWHYKHRFYESSREWTDASEDNMCPSFFPLPLSPEGGKMSGKYLLSFISHNKGAQYYIGDYRDDHFYPEQHGRMSWQDNHFFAPEALVDDQGRQILWSWIFDVRPAEVKKHYGWTGMYSLPRTLWLTKEGTLGIRPVKELEKLRLGMREEKNIRIKAGEEISLDGFGSELMELEITLQAGAATQAGVKVNYAANGEEQTSIYYDAGDKTLKFDTTKSGHDWGEEWKKKIEAAPFELKKAEPLVLRVFVDKSVVEVFANDRQAIARTVYPKLNGTGVRLFAKGADVKVLSVKAWRLAPANPY